MNRVTCSGLSFAVITLATAAVAMPSFGDWSAPANLESLPASSINISTASVDGCASHSSDGLTIAFNSDRDGNQDLFMATRSSTGEGFGDPQKLPAPINSSAIEFCPTITNGNRLYFSSARDDPSGDLYVTRLGPKGWTPPERLGQHINSGLMDEAAAFYEDDDGNEVMLFSSRNLNGTGGKIYQSVNGSPASLVAGGPHSSASDNRPSVTHDGRTIFWDSTRSGGLGGPDLYVATRTNTSQPWGSAVHLQSLSSSGFDARPVVSWRGKLLTFSSSRGGNVDIWFAAR